MTQDIITLIQAEVDGQNTSSDSQKLAELCRQDPAIQTELDAAMAVGRALNHLSDARLPDGFSSRVMNALPDEPAWARSHVQQQAPARPAIKLWARPWANLAYGLVVGAFVMFAAMSVLQPDAVPIEGVSGSMITPDINPDIEETVTLDDSHAVDVSIWNDDSGITAQLVGSMPAGSSAAIIINLPNGDSISIPINRP